MIFYVVNATSAKALEVLNCQSSEEADRLTRERYGDKAIVIDEVLYKLECQVGYFQARDVLKRLVRESKKKARRC